MSALSIAAGCAALTAAPAVAAPFEVGGDIDFPGPDIAVDDGGTGHIAWSEASSGDDPVQYCRLPRGATACAPSLTLSPPEDGFGGPRVLLGAGRVILLTARCCSQAGSEIHIYQSTDGGQTFSGPTKIGTGSDLDLGGEAAFGPGEFRTSTIGSGSNGTFYQAAPIDPQGAPVDQHATVGPDCFEEGCTVEGSIGFIDPLTPIVAFYSLDEGKTLDDDTTYFRAYGGSGDYNDISSWGPISPVGPGDEPKLASGVRGTYLLNRTGAPARRRYVVRRFDPITSTFPGPPTPVSPAGDPIFRDFIQDGGGNLHAIWSANDADLSASAPPLRRW